MQMNSEIYSLFKNILDNQTSELWFVTNNLFLALTTNTVSDHVKDK